MADDQVRIDPQFSPPPPGDGHGRRLRLVGVAAMVVAAVSYGWMLRAPSPTESDEVAVTSSTLLTDEAPTTTRPSTATTDDLPEVSGLALPLGEAVPGFTDTITMAV